MSRSRRKTPILSYCTADDHEHWWKHAANRALRRAVRMALQRGSETLPLLREVSNNWTWPKDGRGWYGWDVDAKWLRK